MSENLSLPPTAIENSWQQPPPRVGSLKEYIDKANSVPHLSPHEMEQLFGCVSDGWALQKERARAFTPVYTEDRHTLAEAEVARHRIATAFLSLVVVKAFERRSPNTSVLNLSMDDLIGAGNLLLYHAIDAYARLPEQQAFTPYAETTIRQGLRHESWCNWLGVRVHSDTIGEIVAYRRERRELARERGRRVSAGEVAERMEIDLERARHLEGFARDRILIEDILPQGNDYLDQLAYKEYAEAHEPEPRLLAISREKKSVWIERGLLTIHRSQAELLRMHFGLDGEPPADTLSVAEHLGVREVTIKVKLKEALDTLREILPQIKAQTFDYAEWQKPHVNSPKTVLTFLSASEIPIPEEHRLPELRALARAQLQKIDYNNRYRKLLERDRGVMIDYYGLDDEGRKYALEDLLQKHGISSTIIYGIEKRIFASFKALQEAGKDSDATP